ncbi:TonB-dependent receptor [Chryseotalea sanaruensis]|uniref:TonB-dependent receptor n=1 Tax=Chryseotalea sanaruensis TaxID=2482724 RepID=A0A401U8Z7_9BACT|nr:TonB-dependent receptor [Chryseotalea sanaruensis]GCC51344.1 TonB-dependent receptor [Chryseotalea sanaruensis]
MTVLKANNYMLTLAEDPLALEEIVVSGTRWSQGSANLPSRISSISNRDMALQNPQTAADLLGASGDVFIQKSQQGGGSPMIRGFSTNRLLYAVDGIRMNTAIFRSGNLQNVISLDPFATEQTEVLFGPGSVIYGSDAIGGVMSFQTLTPQLASNGRTFTSGKAVARYASANKENTFHFDVNAGWKKWALVTSFSSNDFGDLKMGKHGPAEYLRPFYVNRQDSVDVIVTNDDPLIQRPSGYSQINVMQKVRFVPSKAWDIQLGLHYSTTSEYSRYDRHVRYRNGLPRYGEWSYGPQMWNMTNLSVTHKQANALYNQLAIRLAHQGFEESRISRDINRPSRETRIEAVQAYSANFDFVKALQIGTLFYGLEFVSDDVTSTGINENIATGVRGAGPARYPQATWASYAAYANYQHTLSEKTTLQVGARYNQFMLDATFDTSFYPFPFTTAEVNKGALTGSTGLVSKISNHFILSVNGSTGFRSPNVDDLGKVFDSADGAVTIPNPDLESEYAYNGEISLVKVFGTRVKTDLTAYYTMLENAMVRRDFLLNGEDSIVYDGELSKVEAIQNAAVATVFGLQANIEIKLSEEFMLSSKFNYQKGEEELDDGTTSPSRHAAPWFGLTRLTYNTKHVTMQFYAQYSGERKFSDLPQEEQGKPEIYAKDENGDPYSPGWYTLNFKANYQANDKIIIGAGLENITDKRYRPYSSGIVAPGRNMVISLTVKF